MPKVLCLHGLGQDGSSFYNRSIRPIADKLPGWQFYCPDGIFPLSAEVNKFKYGEGNIAITDDKQSNDAAIGAALTARAIVQSMEVEEQFDPLRPNPRSSSSRRNQLKSHAESYLQSSPHINKSQEQLVQSLKGAKLRSWIVQVPPTFPDEGMWTSFDASLHFLARYIDENGPFDGIIGFSQGGMVASIIAKILAGVDAGCEPEFNPSIKVNHRLSFVVFGSVMQFDPNNSPDQLRKDLLQMSKRWSKLQQPPFHVLSIWGIKDKFFSQEDFEKMSILNNSVNVATFPFGHLIPNKDPWPSILAEWMSKAVQGSDIEKLAAVLGPGKSNL